MTTEDAPAATPTARAPSSWWRRVRVPRRRDGRASLTLELAVVAWLFWLYDVINNLAPTRVALARTDAHGLLAAERSLHLDIELGLNRWLSAHAVLAFISTYYYFFSHVIVTLGLLVLLWWRRPDLYRRLRTPLVFINLIAFAVFWRYPLAPPRMLAGLGFRDVIASTHAVISWDSGALVHDADQLAAMPSLHVAWALWSSLALWQMVRARLVRVLTLMYPLLTTAVVLGTGNHWLLDVLAGAGTFVCGVALSSALAWLRVSRRSTLGLPERRAPRDAQGLGMAHSGAAKLSERLAHTSSGPT